MAVVDVGSTGSRLHIYAYDLDGTGTAVNITELWNKKVKPGFATLEANQETIDAYLTNLMAGAPVANLPVYFYATAGMRLLSAPKQQVYYQNVQSWFANQNQWQLIAAKTITGMDEALYDWLSVNYQLGNLNTDANKSVGVMDMGGASVQIVFANEDNVRKESNNQVEVDVYGKHYVLNTFSFLGLGQTEVSHQFMDSIPCYANNYPLPDGDIAKGDVQTCTKEVAQLVNSVHGVNNIIAPLIESKPTDSWYVIGGLVSLANTKPIHFDSNQLTLDQLAEQAQDKICNQNWDVLNTQYPNNEYVFLACFASAYYYALVVDGYGFTPSQTINMFPADQPVDWTRGVVLHH